MTVVCTYVHYHIWSIDKTSCFCFHHLLCSRKTEVVTILRIAYFEAVREELTIALQNV